MSSISRRVMVLSGTAALVFAGVAVAQGQKLQTFDTEPLSIRTTDGLHNFRVEIARRPRQQSQGLMFRRHLAADSGMLFLYTKSARATMWMKNTYIPLDMIFVDRTGKIVGFTERTVPGSLQVITSEMPVSAVLEVNAGTVSRLRIAIGDRVLHPAFQAGQ